MSIKCNACYNTLFHEYLVVPFYVYCNWIEKIINKTIPINKANTVLEILL